jgi:hypothetical protein
MQFNHYCGVAAAVVAPEYATSIRNPVAKMLGRRTVVAPGSRVFSNGEKKTQRARRFMLEKEPAV